MKKITLYLVVITTLMITSCSKKELNQIDPNNPSPSGSLATEGGMKAYGAGILGRTLFDVPNSGVSNILHISLTNHSLMGDEMFLPYGNFGFRWVNQVYNITLPNGTVSTNPFGVTQQVSLQGFNSIGAGDRNAFMYEWTLCYFFIQQANQMLASLDKGISYDAGGDNATKKATFQAWAYWWKAYAYSRIGSLYLAGIITNDPLGGTNASFVHHDAIIVEANKQFDNCVTALDKIAPASVAGDYTTLMKALVLSFNDNENVVTPDMWKRQINTYKARNLLANKKVSTMTTADWNNVITLCNAGLQPTDNIFNFGMTKDGNNDLSNSWMHPFAFTGPNTQWTFVSERLVQEFKTGDDRFTKGILQLPAPPNVDPTYDLSAFANIRSRGYQFGTRWAAKPIEDGGLYATGSANSGLSPLACTYEENALMLAEALINTNQIEAGLAQIDAVRTFQNAALPATVGTGLSLSDAKEELRRERRIGLFLKGVAFYDARRWGVTAPVTSGGGRAGGIVYVPQDALGVGTPAQAVPCLLNYSYMDYWDVPQNELDLNAPATGSATVANPK
ncbi:MAG: RagB/SusD family nutrient uptake outer membrane protein [Chitinophagaceae bacterium]